MARLPQRPREHVLETETENFVRRILPSKWLIEKRQHDYGIDFRVEIVQGDNVTAAHFTIQLKGTDQLKVRKKAYIAHDCKTSALRYYLEHPELVIYLVYSAKEDVGYWVWIQEFIRDQLDPHWKNQEKVSIRIPKTNIFDSHAVRTIKQRVLHMHEQARWLQAVQTANNPYYTYALATTNHDITINVSPRYPGAEKDKPITFRGTFKFDQSNEGRAALDDFNRAIKTGTSIKLDSRFFEGFDVSAAFSDVFAHVEELHLSTVELSPLISEQKIITRLLVLDSENKVLGELPYIELRELQAGTEEITYSNEHQDIPLKLRQVINKVTQNVSLQLSVDLINQNVAHIREFFVIRRALTQAKYVKLVNLATQQAAQMNISRQDFPEIDEEFVNLMEDLAFIQERMNVTLLWPGEIKITEIVAIQQVITALSTRSYKLQVDNLTITVDKSMAQGFATLYEETPEIQLGFPIENMSFNIFGNELSLGQAHIIFSKVTFQDKTLQILQDLVRLPENALLELMFDIKEPGIVQFLAD